MFHLAWLLFSLLQTSVIGLWGIRAFPAVRRHRWLFVAGLAGLCVAQNATRWVVVHAHIGGTVEMVLIVVLMTMGIASLPIALLLVGSWIAQRRARRRTEQAPEARPPDTMTRRQMVEAVGGLGFLGATGTMLGWGMIRGRHAFEIDEVPVRIPGLPRALDGYVIAQVSDLHGGTYVDERLLAEGLDRVRQARPDLLVVTGDLVDFDPGYVPLVARKLLEVAPRDGIYGCLGNHDDYAGADAVLEGMRRAGITMLVNDGCVLRARDGGGFALLGVPDQWTTRYRRSPPDLARALATVPSAAPRILLSHQPVTVDRWAGQVALQLSGHTHGGQINPGFRPADFFMQYVAGAYAVKGTSLYVNRGFGTVGPPSRVGAPPEISRIVLVAA